MALDQITAFEEAEPLDGSELLEVSQLSTTVVYTASTIGALATDNRYTDSADGFIAAGFEIGHRVNVQGFTGNVANNIFVGQITDLAIDSMEIASPEGDVIVDDAEGESVTITKWETRRSSLDDVLDLVGASLPIKYRFGFSIEGTAPAGLEVMLRHVLQHDVTFPDNFANSVGRKPPGGSNPATSQAFDILHNGSSIGSVTISTGGAFTWNTTGGALAAVAGDEIRVQAPAAPDANVIGMSFTIYGEEA